jgi:hypothetical protein
MGAISPYSNNQDLLFFPSSFVIRQSILDIRCLSET